MKPEENGEAASDKTCETPGCDKEARLQCPTCIKLNIKVGLIEKENGKNTDYLKIYYN